MSFSVSWFWAAQLRPSGRGPGAKPVPAHLIAMRGVTLIHDFTPLPTKDHVAANRIFRVRNAECGVRKQGKNRGAASMLQGAG